MNRRIRALGEVALKVHDLDTMQAFYADVVGLELLKRFETAAFFRIAEGYAGHTAVIALFARGTDVDQTQSPLDHLAFTIALEDYEAEKSRLESLGLEVMTAEHGWVSWRSLHVNDPEGNLVELVCHDPDLAP